MENRTVLSDSESDEMSNTNKAIISDLETSNNSTKMSILINMHLNYTILIRARKYRKPKEPLAIKSTWSRIDRYLASYSFMGQKAGCMTETKILHALIL